MKIKAEVTEITKDDLVNLLCTATYLSNWLGIRIPKGNYTGTELENENDCKEDKWAKVLLAGKELYADDHYAEDMTDIYGSLPHKWRFNKNPDDGWMRYTFTLEDVKKGLGKALSEGGYPAECANDLMSPDSVDFDLNEAELLMQYIIFGEEIYG